MWYSFTAAGDAVSVNTARNRGLKAEPWESPVLKATSAPAYEKIFLQRRRTPSQWLRVFVFSGPKHLATANVRHILLGKNKLCESENLSHIHTYTSIYVTHIPSPLSVLYLHFPYLLKTHWFWTFLSKCVRALYMTHKKFFSITFFLEKVKKKKHQLSILYYTTLKRGDP